MRRPWPTGDCRVQNKQISFLKFVEKNRVTRDFIHNFCKTKIRNVDFVSVFLPILRFSTAVGRCVSIAVGFVDDIRFVVFKSVNK